MLWEVEDGLVGVGVRVGVGVGDEVVVKTVTGSMGGKV